MAAALCLVIGFLVKKYNSVKAAQTVSTGPSACSGRGPESWQYGKSTRAATVEPRILEHCPGAPRRELNLQEDSHCFICCLLVIRTQTHLKPFTPTPSHPCLLPPPHFFLTSCGFQLFCSSLSITEPRMRP